MTRRKPRSIRALILREARLRKTLPLWSAPLVRQARALEREGLVEIRPPTPRDGKGLAATPRIIVRATAALALLAVVLLPACARRADQIAPSHVPASRYAAADCAGLHAEAEDVAARLAALIPAQDQRAGTDAVLTGVGLVVFWPALIFASGLAGGGDNAAAIAALKGESEAIRTAWIRRGCGA